MHWQEPVQATGAAVVVVVVAACLKQ